MLKGNLIVDKNQSVVIHANSLRDLVKLAETKSSGTMSLRVDLGQTHLWLDSVLDTDAQHSYRTSQSLTPDT